MPVGNEALDYLYHAVDVVRRSRVVVGAQDAQSIHLLVKALDVVLRQLAYAPVVSLGHLNDAVFDVSEVLHVMDLVIPVFQVAAQHVKYDVRKGVTYVARAVQVGAAYVHGHLLPKGSEVTLFAGEGVVQPHPLASTVAMANAPMPSPRPGNPRPSEVVHFIFTCNGDSPVDSAIFSRILCT